MKGRFPAMSLAINPPLAPMEARDVDDLPSGATWQYEPKWDGFRCLAFRDGRTVVLQAKSGEPLTRYFPEVVMAIASIAPPSARFLLDGEIVVIGAGRLSYDDLMGRIHPSARKVAQLSAKSPATFLAFDLLAENAESLVDLPLADRRRRLERFFKAAGTVSGVQLCPATTKKTEALSWLKELGPAGVDGVMAKRKDQPYTPGEREAMVKLKLARTADCVVAGVRRSGDGGAPATTLLLGLYDEEGLLHYVGTTAPLPEDARKGIDKLVAPLVEPPGFSGRQPPGRTSGAAAAGAGGAKARDFEPLRAALVCEVRYDRFVEGRFRSPPDLVRFRPDKKPHQCTFAGLRPAKAQKGPGLERIGL